MRYILILCLVCVLCTGCTNVDQINRQATLEANQRMKEGVKNKTNIICIDGVEYIRHGSYNRGYMAPHLSYDKFNNLKVIRCEE